jgi:hypothetical protein
MELFTEDPEDEWVTETLKFLLRYFSIAVYHLFIYHTILLQQYASAYLESKTSTFRLPGERKQL